MTTDEIGLVRRVAGGDETAMRVIYETHCDAVHRFVATRLKDPFEIADIVHSTMLDVWRLADRFEGRSSLRSWILTIARNKSVDHIRKYARVSTAEPDGTIPDETPDAHAILSAAQEAAIVRECISKLAPHHKAAIHLAFFDDLNYAQIGEIEGCPEGTVKTRIHHAKKLLMRCITRNSQEQK